MPAYRQSDISNMVLFHSSFVRTLYLNNSTISDDCINPLTALKKTLASLSTLCCSRQFKPRKSLFSSTFSTPALRVCILQPTNLFSADSTILMCTTKAGDHRKSVLQMWSNKTYKTLPYAYKKKWIK